MWEHYGNKKGYQGIRTCIGDALENCTCIGELHLGDMDKFLETNYISQLRLL